MTQTEKIKGTLFGLLFCLLGIALSLAVSLQPSWTQAPLWMVYFGSSMFNLLGLICIAACQDWRRLRNILIFILTFICGSFFAWYAVGFGPRECMAGHVLEHGLSCRVPFGLGSLLWFLCAWGAISGKIQD